MTTGSLAAAWAELDVARYKSEFYRMWYAGHHAGLTHPQCFEAMDDFRRSPTVHDLKKWLHAGTKRRATLAQLIAAKPKLFLPFEAALLRLGEESGALEHCLMLLADYFAAEHRLLVWIKKKLSYPMFQAFAACFIGPFPLLFFGHTVQYLVTSLGSATALVLAGGSILRLASHWFGQRPKFVRARLLRALTTALEAGLTMDRAVALAVEASDSDTVKAHVAAQGKAVGRQPLGKTFEGCGVIPREAIAAMNVAEVTGDYSSTLAKLAAMYDGDYAKA